MSVESSRERDTARLEAFSDGVFAFAMTLLVLGLKDPTLDSGGPLLQGLVNEWPAFFAFVTSFATILVMWMNHHNLFNYIRRVGRAFMLLNGLLLLTVTLVPFTTSLVANHIALAGANTAAQVYTGEFFLLAVVFNVLWRYGSSRHRLLGRNVTNAQVRDITRQYHAGPTSYAVAFLGRVPQRARQRHRDPSRHGFLCCDNHPS